MKYTGSVVAGLALMTGLSSAFPALEEVRKKLPVSRRASTELIGDIATLQDGQLSQTGKDVKAILQAQARGVDTTSNYTDVPDMNSPECAKDKCCIWKYIADDMRDDMVGDSGRCNNLARAAVRLGFHDAGTWSKKTTGGGADGSLVLAGECEERPENNGLQDVCSQTRTWFDKYKAFNISMADLIQMGANVGTVACPLGPRVRSFVGRKDGTGQSPRGNIPSPFDSADQLISLFADKTISPEVWWPWSAPTRAPSSASSTRTAPATRSTAPRASGTPTSTARCSMPGLPSGSSSSRATWPSATTRARAAPGSALSAPAARDLGTG